MTNAIYEILPVKENNEPLIDLAKFDFILEPSYFNQGLANENRMFLREGVVKKLALIQRKLKIYQFKIWDGFRSRTVQNNIYRKFWNEMKTKHPDWNDDRLKIEVGVFVTAANDITRIPPHASGGAVDLTLVDLAGKELAMGTEFDHFGPEAHSAFYDEHNLDLKIRKNRTMLREAMMAEGFSQYSDEWWHFDYGNQLWAFTLNKPCAFYGEAFTPSLVL